AEAGSAGPGAPPSRNVHTAVPRALSTADAWPTSPWSFVASCSISVGACAAGGTGAGGVTHAMKHNSVAGPVRICLWTVTSTAPMPTEQQWTSAKARARLYAALREYFARSGFLEVEPPLMVPLPAMEPHIDPFAVKGRYLHTSPEYAMKRLLADPDAPPLFQICKVFRDEPASVTHNPEFTLLEFYRPHAD